MSITEMHVTVFRLTCKSVSVRVNEASIHPSSFWYTEKKKKKKSSYSLLCTSDRHSEQVYYSVGLWRYKIGSFVNVQLESHLNVSSELSFTRLDVPCVLVVYHHYFC